MEEQSACQPGAGRNIRKRRDFRIARANVLQDCDNLMSLQQKLGLRKKNFLNDS